ncbi:hypothetical protein MKEN_01072800 [Mycena kentingensis (nom. inval.)]|nr:hypothetical protein MKEN_01072800 [Mycena kentingensis (nom. inval.)]
MRWVRVWVVVSIPRLRDAIAMQSSGLSATVLNLSWAAADGGGSVMGARAASSETLAFEMKSYSESSLRTLESMWNEVVGRFREWTSWPSELSTIKYSVGQCDEAPNMIRCIHSLSRPTTMDHPPLPSSASAPSTPLPELYFPDGNLIILTHNDNVVFRVYSGLLAARSPVFAELLAQPQPDDAEKIDATPVMRLEDSAADLLYFLRAIFDYEFFAPYPAKTDFDAIHGILKMSTKYGVEPLRRRALQHLTSAHPTSISVWDSLCGPSTGTRVFAIPAYAGPSFDFSHLELPIITLARETRADWILPTAFFRALATLSSADILDGIDYTSVHVELDRADKVLLLEAGPVLLGEPTAEMLGFLWSPTVIANCEYANTPTGAGAASNGIMNACTSNRLLMRVAAERWRSDALALLPICVSLGAPKGCAAAGAGEDDGAVEVIVSGMGTEPTKEAHPSSDAMQTESASPSNSEAPKMQPEEDQEGRAIWSEEDFSRLSVCRPCLAHMKADWAKRREIFWDRLPSLFGLPSWAQLEKQRLAAVGW